MALAALAVLAAAALLSIRHALARGAELSRFRAELSARDADLSVARGELGVRAAEISRLRAEQSLIDSRLRQAEGSLAQAQAEKAALGATIDAREQRLGELRIEKDRQLAELRAERELQLDELRAERDSLRLALRSAEGERADLEASRAALIQQHAAEKEKVTFLQQAEQRLNDAFSSSAAAAMSKSTEQLLALASTRFAQLQEGAQGDLAQREQAIDALVSPLREKLDELSRRNQELEVSREGAYHGLTQQVRALSEQQLAATHQTQRLITALRTPHTRGRWGEIQLRRVVEVAGLQEHCDFEEQATVTTEEGTLRPDLVITLPGDARIVIDAKAPLGTLLGADQSGEPLDDLQRRELHRSHARAVRNHVESLSSKAYWAQLKNAPEFVVLFLPTEGALSAALEGDPELFELAMQKRVVLASPMSLIALLRTAALAWKQDKLAESAAKIQASALELYNRISTLTEHFAAMGKHLKGSVDAYNKTLGSLESRVLPAARKFKEYGVVAEDAELPLLLDLEGAPRAIQAPELLAASIPDSAN